MRDNKKIAKRYAKAFLHEKLDRDAFFAMTDEVGGLVKAIHTDENIREFFISPASSREVKLKISTSIVRKLEFSGYTLSLLETLIRKNRMAILGDVYEELRELSDQMFNRVRVKVTTAVEPSTDDLEEMARRISSFFSREARVERQIDPSIIGGFIIEGDGKLIDMSVMGQIRRALSIV